MRCNGKEPDVTQPIQSIDDVAFDASGLVPVVAQDAHNGEVLMLAYANREALEMTLTTGEGHYFSRSRNALWRKGATSGHTQVVHDVWLDCDGDALVYRVTQTGPACHTGERSCFHRPLTAETAGQAHEAWPELLQRVVAERLEALPEGSYVTELHQRGTGYVAQKVVEEAGETIVAALQDQKSDLAEEAADLIFHLAVLLKRQGLDLDAAGEVLAARHRARG